MERRDKIEIYWFNIKKIKPLEDFEVKAHRQNWGLEEALLMRRYYYS